MGCFEKVHGGYKVDGLELKAANCGCGGLTGPGGSGVGDCCMTFSRVKHEGNSIKYFGKNTTPNTTDNYEWGYKVKKGDHEIEVQMLDTRGPKNFKFGGSPPPPVVRLEGKGLAGGGPIRAARDGNRRAAAGMVRQPDLGVRAAGGGTGIGQRG